MRKKMKEWMLISEVFLKKFFMINNFKIVDTEELDKQEMLKKHHEEEDDDEEEKKKGA